MKKKGSNKQSGSTLAVVIATLAILMVIVGVAVEYTTNINRNTQRTTTLQTAVAVGDSAIEVLFNNWRAICSGKEQTSGGALAAPSGTPLPTSAFSAVPTPSPFPNLPSTNFVKRGTGLDPTTDGDYDATYKVSNYKVIAVSAEYTSVPNGNPNANATPEPQLGQLNQNVNNNSAQMNTTSATWNYIASADVTLQASFGSSTGRNVVARVRRVFSKQQLSPWNFAIFYIDPLEIHPGPQFTVTGWVNTNSNLYTAHNTLTFADKVTYGGDWYVNFMPGDTYHNAGSDAEMGPPTYPSGLPPARGQALQPFGLDSTSIFSTTDSNPNNDSYAELIQPPVSGYTDPLAGERYWDQAGVVIRINGDNTYTIGTPNLDGSITSLAPPPSPLPDTRTPNQKNLYNMFNGAITTNETIQDNREGASMRIASLDVSQIESADPNPDGNGVKYKAPNFNGIVYIYDASETSSARRGIRLKNGSKIPFGASQGASGLTVASNNPVYIQGDFNTGGTGTTVPSNNPSNFNADGTYVDPSNPPNPQVSGYTRAPCSVLADAVNLLSNSWNDATSGTVPTASATTFNTAIVSGIVPTNVNGDGAYSGGAENFPRFLENWTNKTLTYYGSMVELYKSQQSVGEWGKANVYVPPSREWFFDNNFKITAPIGSLMVYSYIKGRWYVL